MSGTITDDTTISGSNRAQARMDENTPGGFGALEAVDGLCDSRPPQAAIFCISRWMQSALGSKCNL